jgi:hypothetical protein
MMGVETPRPSITMNPPHLKGASPRRINDLKENAGNLLAPPYLEEALRRGIIVTRHQSTDFHTFGVSPYRITCVTTEPKNKITPKKPFTLPDGIQI